MFVGKVDPERGGADTTLRVLILPCHLAAVVEMAVREMGLLVLLMLENKMCFLNWAR